MSALLQRLIGLETEYAIRFSPSHSSAPTPPKYQIYEAVCRAVGQRVLTVPAKHFKEGIFSANGGAIWFEAERPSAGGGLIEGATPECRSPKELLAYQRAQDRLLRDSAADAVLPGQLRLIKNDRDAFDNIYGAQENYEACFADGISLLGWRIGLVLLFPVAMITWAAILLSVLATLSYFAIAAAIYLPIRLAFGERRTVAMLLFGRDLADGRETCIHVPVWLESTLQLITRLLTAPLAISLHLLLMMFAFRRQRNQMTAFFVSRAVLGGAGMLDAKGTFQLSDKAPAINCQLGFGGMLFDRPIYSMGHFFKEIYAESWFSPRNYFQLFADRQRLQIAIGDSNMSETAEWLRVGSTALVLDACEAGALRKPPFLSRPIRALRKICSDPTLETKVRTRGGRFLSALEIQQYYFQQCQAYVSRHLDAPAEAHEILRVWEETLESLEQIAAGDAAPNQLVGSIDWVTKKYLLDNAASDGTWHEQKKIDICFHELSPEGYFQLLSDAGVCPTWLSESDVDRAVRTPPANSPAATRGRYIREFANSDTPVAVNWKAIFLGRHWSQRVIRIGDYGKAVRQRPGVRSRVAGKY